MNRAGDPAQKGSVMKLTIFDQSKKEEILKTLPEFLKVLKDHLIVKWTEQDINRRDHMNADHAKMDRREFENKWGNKTYSFRKLSDHAIAKSAIHTAENYVFGIVNRIQEMCGKIKDCSKVIVDDCAISGIIKCENGSVKIQTFLINEISRIYHNVKLEIIECVKKEESHDLNYWLNILDQAIETNDFNNLNRARFAIKKIKNIMKGGADPNAKVQLSKVA